MSLRLGSERKVATPAQDDVIQQGDPEGSAGRHQLSCDRAVILRRTRVPRGVVVNHHNTRSALGDREPEDLPRMDERGIQDTASNQHFADHAVPRVEEYCVKLLLAKVLEAWSHKPVDIRRTPDEGPGRDIIYRSTSAELESGKEPPRDRHTYAGHRLQNGGIQPGEASKRALGQLEQPRGDVLHGVVRSTAPYDQGQKLG